MQSLACIQLAGHKQLLTLPSFQGLSNLKGLAIAALPSLLELPCFESIQKLERLELVALGSIVAIPDMAPLAKLVYFTVNSRGLICCNGFLDSICDLTHPFCLANPYFMLPAATCLNSSSAHATASTLAMINKFAPSVCQTDESPPGIDHINKTQIDFCQGVLFRQCPANADGVIGICASMRMQPIMCIHDLNVVKMRREQIRLGIGASCMASEEA